MSNTSITITGVVTDADGSTSTFSASAFLDTITIVSATIVPATAPSGTTRTLTVVANSSANAVLTFNLPTATGITFTAVANQVSGTGKWTFVY